MCLDGKEVHIWREAQNGGGQPTLSAVRVVPIQLSQSLESTSNLRLRSSFSHSFYRENVPSLK